MNRRSLVVVFALLFVVSVTVPVPALPGGADKVLHLLAGVGLVAVASWRLGEARGAGVAVGVLAGVELLQTVIPYRHPGTGDLLAGAVGVALGVVLRRLRERVRAE